MSKPNITNGPWESQLTRIYGGNKLLFTGDWWDSPEELEQAEANASLAAAAPEMYDLLQKIMLEAYVTLDESGEEIIAIPDGVISSINSILRKARGEK